MEAKAPRLTHSYSSDIHNHGTCCFENGSDLEQLIDVVPDVIVRKSGVEDLEVGVVHKLKDETGSLGLGVSDDVEELDHIRTATKVLENLNLPLDLQAAA